MGDFFKGWQRKTGAVMLLSALAFMSGWVRSQVVCDGICFDGVNGRPYFVMASTDNTLVIGTTIEVGAQWEMSLPEWQSSERVDIEKELGDEFDWSWRFLGFGVGEDPDRLRLWFIPYWSIVIPLTLHSASLLLCRSRTVRPNAIEPTPAEGA